jgi:predicted flap endonuclease-1-like 5' DNA nuclease
MRIDEVEGIGSTYAAKLADAGVATTDDLLMSGAKPGGRDRIAEATGISGKLILEWVNHVDLMRIDGVGSEYSDLLEAAGVDSPAELAQRNAANLATTFKEVDAARPNMVRRVPSEETVAGWITAAGKLDKIVEH